jgi:membrane dipeptidase
MLLQALCTRHTNNETLRFLCELRVENIILEKQERLGSGPFIFVRPALDMARMAGVSGCFRKMNLIRRLAFSGKPMTHTANPPIFDGHNDWLTIELRARAKSGLSFFTRRHEGHLDFVRAREGGYGGGFFAIMVPDPTLDKDAQRDYLEKAARGETPTIPPLDPHYAQRMAIASMATLFRDEERSDGRLQVVRTRDELIACLLGGVIAAVIHLEGAEPIDPNLDSLLVFHKAGLRSMGIVWGRSNAFGHGVPFAFPNSPDIGPGLTDAGRNLVRACNKLGIMIDLSHLNEKGFWDVARLTDAPLVATHSAAHALCPSPRNLTDKQIDAIGESHGVIGVNFHVGFLRQDGREDLATPLTEIVRHLDYIVKRIGIDCVALGSDFDGATMPSDLGDAAGLPRLLDALRAAGYDETSLRKIACDNWLRVLDLIWK